MRKRRNYSFFLVSIVDVIVFCSCTMFWFLLNSLIFLFVYCKLLIYLSVLVSCPNDRSILVAEFASTG